jgi:asparagine synthase (glutamine-hydrolysing)
MNFKHRGPDNTNIYIEKNTFIGFHRLAINDVHISGNQPMVLDDVIMICNGEIYNFKKIMQKYNIECASGSDCEVILRLYISLKEKDHDLNKVMHTLCSELEGEFAFIIYDKQYDSILAARDRYGVRPLFVAYNQETKDICFSSELKGLDDLFNSDCMCHQFTPSYFMIVNLRVMSSQGTLINHAIKVAPYHSINTSYDTNINNLAVICSDIRKLLSDAVKQRCVSDVPMCALLSGGLDSSLVCGLLAKNVKTPINTFSIGLPGSPDLEYARQVATFIRSNHHEVIISEHDMLSCIEEVIKTIESYDITTVRASIPNYLVAKYIKDNTNFKVVFSGEYSDEVFSGYMYNKKAPSVDELHKEANHLLKNICYFDSLRADRCISAHGLEARCPFSSTNLIKYVLSIDPDLRMSDDKIEKYILRKAFEKENIIPWTVINRSKAAFSDAVSTKENSWHTILKTHIDNHVSDDEFQQDSIKFLHNTPVTKEAYYYRKIFHKYYNHDKVIPYFWMPNQKWVGHQTDPSARELGDIYQE